MKNQELQDKMYEAVIYNDIAESLNIRDKVVEIAEQYANEKAIELLTGFLEYECHSDSDLHQNAKDYIKKNLH